MPDDHAQPVNTSDLKVEGGNHSSNGTYGQVKARSSAVHYAAGSASSTDGMTRGFGAMCTFNVAKTEYDALEKLEGKEYDDALHALHCKHSQTALNVAKNNGGIFVKIGQFIASLEGASGDAIPREYVEALAELTDKAPAQPFATVSQVVSEDFGRPLEHLVRSVGKDPIAAGSLAQVHVAETHEGAAVAVKLQYPHLRAQAEADLDTFETMASMLQPGDVHGSLLHSSSRFDCQRKILFTAQHLIVAELDFGIERQNGEAARAALAHLAPHVCIPKAIAELCSSRVLATEFMLGLTRVDDPVALAEQQIDTSRLGGLVASVFAELSLVHGLVHGDPHAGNVYGRAEPSAQPHATQLVVVDHGLYHKLSRSDRLALCDLLLACATPFPRRAAVRRLAEGFAGPLWSLFPLLLSPAFALSTPLSMTELRAAAKGHLPPSVTLKEVWRALEAMHQGSSNLLGFLHSMGYVRSLLSELRFAEEQRVRALVHAATRAVCEARHTWLKPVRLFAALVTGSVQVFLLFRLLDAVSFCLEKRARAALVCAACLFALMAAFAAHGIEAWH